MNAQPTGHLVLARRIGEKVQIGPDVVIEVVSIKGGMVRLAFTAPRSINIRRTELPPRDTP